VFSLSFSSAGKRQFLTGIFKTTYIVSVNLQEVAGGKKFLELLLEAVNFSDYHLISRTLLIPSYKKITKSCTHTIFCKTRQSNKREKEKHH